MTRPLLNRDLVVQYKKLRRKHFLQTLREGDGGGTQYTEMEKQVFIDEKIAKELEEFSEMKGEKGNQSLVKLIHQDRELIEQGRSANPMVLSPSKPPDAPKKRGRRAHSLPVSSGGVDAMRGTVSHLPFLQHAGRRSGYDSPTPSISLTNVEHYSAGRHSASNESLSFWHSPQGKKHKHLRDKPPERWLQPEHPGQHGTPIPAERTSMDDVALQQFTEFMNLGGEFGPATPEQKQDTSLDDPHTVQTQDTSLETTIGGELASFDTTQNDSKISSLEPSTEHSRILLDKSLETTIGGDLASFDTPKPTYQSLSPIPTSPSPSPIPDLLEEEETFPELGDSLGQAARLRDTFKKLSEIEEKENVARLKKSGDVRLQQLQEERRKLQQRAVAADELRRREHAHQEQMRTDPEYRKAVLEEKEATDIVRRQQAAHKKLHTIPGTGVSIPDAPRGALPISQPAYLEALRLERHPPPTAAELPILPEVESTPEPQDPNLSRVVGEDLNRSIITAKGLPRAQTAYLSGKGHPPIRVSDTPPKKERLKKDPDEIPYNLMETPQMSQPPMKIIEAGAQGTSPNIPVHSWAASIEHKPVQHFESVGMGDFAGGSKPSIQADDPHRSQYTSLSGLITRKDKGTGDESGVEQPTWYVYKGTEDERESVKTRGEGGGGGKDKRTTGEESGGTQEKVTRPNWGDRMRNVPAGGGGGGDPDSSGYDTGGAKRPIIPRGRGHKKRPPRGRGRKRRGRGLVTVPPRVGVAPPQQLIVHTQQPAIIPVVPQGVVGVGGVVSKDKPGINIKITNKAQAIINEKKKRRKVTTARKEYSKLRRETIKAIRKGRASHYKAESAKLKTLPVKKRKVARDQLKNKLRLREVRLVGQLPSASKMSLKDLDRVIRVARKLRW